MYLTVVCFGLVNTTQQHKNDISAFFRLFAQYCVTEYIRMQHGILRVVLATLLLLQLISSDWSGQSLYPSHQYAALDGHCE